VLWKSVEVLGAMREETGLPLRVAIYTIDRPRENYRKELFQHVKSRFSIVVPPSLPLAFVHLHDDVRPPPFRRFSMIAESIQTVGLAWRALRKLTPDVYVDTTGAAFTFFAARCLAGCRVGAYVHYPTISTDMLSMVWERRPSYNNDTAIASNRVTTYFKLAYYTAFAVAYGLVGSLASLVMVNSTWTKEHVRYLWRGVAREVRTVYPPCDTAGLRDIDLSDGVRREDWIVSIGQFRPEKDHALQIRAFALLLEKLEGTTAARSEEGGVELVLIGSCRNKEDEGRVTALEALAAELGVASRVKFVLNEPYPTLKRYLARGSIGLHTMWNEHFGIGVVEMMAAGLVTVAHNSGGPKMDIVRDGETGYLARTAEEYADVMATVLKRGEKENVVMRRKARESAERFSDEVYSESFREAVLRSGILDGIRT